MNKIKVKINRESITDDSVVDVTIPWAYRKGEAFYVSRLSGELCELNDKIVEEFTQKLTLASYVEVVSDRISSSTIPRNTALISLLLFKKVKLDCDGITFSVRKSDVSGPPMMYLVGDHSLRLVWTEFDEIAPRKFLNPTGFAVVQEKYLPEITYAREKQPNIQTNISMKVDWSYSIKDMQILMYKDGDLVDSKRTLKENIDSLSEFIGGFDKNNTFYLSDTDSNKHTISGKKFTCIDVFMNQHYGEPIDRSKQRMIIVFERVDENGVEFSLVGDVPTQLVSKLTSEKYKASFIWSAVAKKGSSVRKAFPVGVSIIPEDGYDAETFYRDASAKKPILEEPLEEKED